MISRDWRCLNNACRNEFHSFDPANPPCPACGCVRVDWIPGGGHIMDMAPRMDRRLRDIADQQGMKNLSSVSPSRSMRAAPSINRPPPPNPAEVRPFGPFGMSAQLSRSRDPHGDIYCTEAPSSVGGKVAIGSLARGRDGTPFNTAVARTPNSTYDPRVNAVVAYSDKRRPK